MGLDLYHVVPAPKKDESFDYFETSDFDANPDFLLKYADLVTEVEVFEDDFEIIVYPDTATRDIVLETNDDHAGKPYIIGDITLAGKEIAAIESENGLESKESMTLRITDNILSNDRLREVYYDVISYETGPALVKVLFYSEKAHQRKGMTEAFYKDFENGKLYFDKASVSKACTYLSAPDDKTREDLQASFKKLFIDSFVEGESIFFASW